MPRIFWPLLAALVVSACTLPRHLPPPDSLRQAENLAQAGQYRQAATLYLHSAKTLPPDQRQHALLYAAEALRQAGDLTEARRLLHTLNPDHLTPDDRITFAFLAAQLALEAEDPHTALTHLDRIDPRRLPASLRRQYHELRARSYALTGNLAAHVRERVQFGRWLTTPKAVEDNNRTILETLLLLPAGQLQHLNAEPHSDLAGWIELVHILRRYPYRSPALDQDLDRWREAFPYHPAGRHRFLERYLAKLKRPYRPPQHIAVLLPASGPYQQAGAAVAAGIETARSLPATWQAQLSHYDSESGDPLNLYQQASAAGAELIIGPLQKAKVEHLTQLDHFTPPVLALNTINGLARYGLYQLALPLEETVEQVAASARLHDHQRALVLIPDSELGERVGQHFLAYWESLGGRILEIEHYNPRAADFSQPIQRLLNIDESKRRFQRLRQIVWEIQFQPRVRHDADFLFLQAGPRQGRLIRPQLLFHRAEHLPVYATRDIYAGHPEPQLDRDLDGIRFCDIPWLLGGDVGNLPTMDAFEAERGMHAGAWLRLAALGMDAWQIPFTLLLDGQTVHGATGLLSLDPEGHIRRRLTCAEFRHGVPEIYGLAPELHVPPQPY